MAAVARVGSCQVGTVMLQGLPHECPIGLACSAVTDSSLVLITGSGWIIVGIASPTGLPKARRCVCSSEDGGQGPGEAMGCRSPCPSSLLGAQTGCTLLSDDAGVMG